MTQSQSGYYRFPDIHENMIIFVSEDDLWSVTSEGGIARRLTANLASVSSPKISPDGKWVAYSALEEGYREIYLMPSQSGFQQRLTYLGNWTTPLCWSADGQILYFSSNFQSPFFSDNSIYQISIDGGEPELVPVGYANQISWGKEKNSCVIGRYTKDTARWKRYRGGRTGEIWLKLPNTQEFTRLFSMKGNVTDPIWIGERIYFISDHEGIGNLYSCNLHGQNIQRHTQHEEFYARNASSDGKTIVYHAGADLYRLDVANNTAFPVPISYHSSHTQTNRKFVKASQHIQGYDISPNGSYTSLVARGQLFSFAHWSGPVYQWGQKEGVRYRFPTWLYDNKTLIAIVDEQNSNGEQKIVCSDTETSSTKILRDVQLGIVRGVFPSPKDMRVAIVNHKNQLILVNCQQQTSQVIDTCLYSRISSVSWNPDAKWLTYDFSINHDISIIRLYDSTKETIYSITPPVSNDLNPVFSNDGKYIFFIGHRAFYPVYDSLRFDLSFIKSAKLYAILLKKDLPSPFLSQAKSPAGDEKNKQENNKEKDEKKKKKGKSKEPVEDSAAEEKNSIDIEGIERRILPFPIEAGMYSNLSTYQNKVFYLEHPRPCTKPDQNSWTDREPKAQELLKVYDLEKLSEETLIKNITNYKLSLKGSTTIVRQGSQLFVYKTGDKPKEKTTNRYSIEDGEIDLGRISVPVILKKEWEQMYREAWLLQREHFWTSDMSGVDWELIFRRYWPLLQRVGSRGEFSDLVWEMQGELGTSHCYEYGGDYRTSPRYPLASLGCSYRLSENKEFYIFDQILYGDSCEEDECSPLLLAGVENGDHLLAVSGIAVGKITPRELLISSSDKEITLTIRKANEIKPQTITVKTLKNEWPLKYRHWVEKNRNYVHEKSQHTIGYVHIPDMGVNGFAEFYRYYSLESKYHGLIVDVRYNGGGHVSQLILETLLRKPIGYKKPRWSQEPYTYPYQAFEGQMVALTNQDAGSDGDIFSHAFKLLKLGKLIGKRTWGGVIGINGQYSLVDGTITTQPEYSSWFQDVGWGIENYGAVPDIEVDIPPKDSIAKIDTQLNYAIEMLLQELKEQTCSRPNFSNRPDCSLPKLPTL